MFSSVKYKLKAGALQFTLFIGVLIILILGAFVLLSQTHKRFKAQNDLLQETIRLADQGVLYTLKMGNTTEALTYIPYPGLKDFQEITVSTSEWGIYRKVKSRAVSKNYEFERNALVGGKRQGDRLALFLANTFSPLVVVGDTRLKGNAYLSEYGLKPGSMGSAYYKQSRLIDGAVINHNNEELPQFSENFLASLKLQFNSYPKSNQVKAINKVPLHNSFKNETQWIYEPRQLILSDSIMGNVVIRSESEIVIRATCYLKDVIVIAPDVTIESGVHGNFQAFAENTINVGANVELNYPSALVLIAEKKNPLQSQGAEKEDPNFISVGANSVIKGSIVYLADLPNINYEPEVYLANGVSLYGDLYCEQNLELKGAVFGSVYTRAFIARDFGSVYRNHLYNGVIDSEELVSEFVGLPIQASTKGIAKWVY